MYFKKFVAFAIAAVAAIVSSGAANATYYTSSGTVELTSAQNHVGPLTAIQSFSGSTDGGAIFTNQINGTSSLTGDIRTVSVQLINSATAFNSNIQFAPFGSDPTQRLIAVSAISGSLTGAGTATFTDGSLFIISTSEATFNPNDPSTWGNNVVATYSLAAPQDVLPGALVGIVPAGPITPQPSGVINVSSLAFVPGVPQGQFLFKSDDPNNNFIHDVLNTPPFPPTNNEGILAQIQQNVITSGIGLTSNGITLDGADLAALNLYATNAGFSDLGGAGTGFASALGVANGAPSAEFWADPTGLGPHTGSGDFFAAQSTVAYLTVQAVPEPGSLTLAGLGALGLGGMMIRRRNKKSA